MSAKNSHTTASYIPWDSAINVVHRLHRDKKYRMSLFISTGIFTGLRVRDLRALRWNDLMGEDTIAIIEHKTKKRRESLTMTSSSMYETVTMPWASRTPTNIVSCPRRGLCIALRGLTSF